MVKIQYVGRGKFNSGALVCLGHGSLYDVEDGFADYLIETFPEKFNLIERLGKAPEPEPVKASEPEPEKVVKKVAKKAPRKTTTKKSED